MRAILRNGIIYPVEPLPVNWHDGMELWISELPADYEDDDLAVDPEFVDRWLERMNALCADSTPEDEAAFEAALAEIRQQGKEIARREMGLLDCPAPIIREAPKESGRGQPLP